MRDIEFGKRQYGQRSGFASAFKITWSLFFPQGCVSPSCIASSSFPLLERKDAFVGVTTGKEQNVLQLHERRFLILFCGVLRYYLPSHLARRAASLSRTG